MNEEDLKNKLYIWCSNKHEWEKDHLEMLPSGDFISDKMMIHSKENHIPFIKYDDIIKYVNEYRENTIESFLKILSYLGYSDKEKIKLKDDFIKLIK